MAFRHAVWRVSLRMFDISRSANSGTKQVDFGLFLLCFFIVHEHKP